MGVLSVPDNSKSDGWTEHTCSHEQDMWRKLGDYVKPRKWFLKGLEWPITLWVRLMQISPERARKYYQLSQGDGILSLRASSGYLREISRALTGSISSFQTSGCSGKNGFQGVSPETKRGQFRKEYKLGCLDQRKQYEWNFKTKTWKSWYFREQWIAWTARGRAGDETTKWG